MEKRGRARCVSFPAPLALRCVFVLALFTLCSFNALALNYPLQPEEINEAYALGRTNNRGALADFLTQYEHDFKIPSDNPTAYVSAVEFRTPYKQIVLRSQRDARYTKRRAAADYRANPSLIFLRIVIALRRDHTGPVPPADKYLVTVSQSKSIEPLNTAYGATCETDNANANPEITDCAILKREILMSFNANQLAPAPTTVKVELLNGQSMETEFNLDKLK